MKKYHIVKTVEDCSSKIYRFRTLKAMNAFIKKFNKKFPNQGDGDDWLDFTITNVTGEINLSQYSCMEITDVK